MPTHWECISLLERDVQEHQILLAVINLPYIVEGRRATKDTEVKKYDGWRGPGGDVEVYKGWIGRKTLTGLKLKIHL